MTFPDHPHVINPSRAGLLSLLFTHYFISLLAALTAFLLARRIKIYWHRKSLLESTRWTSPHSRPPSLIPQLLPYIGHFLSNAFSYHTFMTHLATTYPTCSALSLSMLSSKHHVIIAPSLVHQVLTDPKITNKFSGEPFFFTLMEKVFGDEGQKLKTMDQQILWGPVAKAVQGMMRESFLTPALATINQGVSERVAYLVSFADNKLQERPWERAADVQPIHHSQPRSAIANLHPLLRDFVGHLAIDILLGPDFLVNYPSTLQDLFTLDSTFSLLLSGVSTRFSRSLKRGVAARTRLLASLRDHHLALHAHLTSASTPSANPKWPRISQTSHIVQERITAFALVGDFSPSLSSEQQAHLSATSNLVLLWALNVNANQVTFWMVFHIFSDRTLLSSIRQEVDPYIVPRNDSHSVDIDLDRLAKSCPLLLGSFLETMRHESAATVYRSINEDFCLTESEDDAKIFGHQVPQTYAFSKGEMIVVPNGTHQSDERYFEDAGRFDARRFWSHDGKAADSDRVRVTYKTMHPWGGGATVCKGKRFAEGEVLTFVAAVVAFWELERVGRDGKPWKEEGWGKHPGHKKGTGAVVPRDDVWVRITRRRS